MWSMLEDRFGHLWFGTGDWYATVGGASRYDGEGFTNFTTQDGLAGDKVLAMLEDRSGHLWFGTDEGVSRYDGEGFTNFTTQDGLANDWTMDILEDEEGNIWFGCWGGVSRYSGNQFATYTTRNGVGGNAICAILEDRDRDLWIGTWGGGLSRYDGGHFTTYTTDDGLISNDIWSLLQDREGNIWYGTREGIGWFDGSGFQNLRAVNECIKYTVSCMLEDRRGNLWIGTVDPLTREGDGLLKYDGKSCTLFTAEDGLPSRRVTAIHEDEDGHLWIGTSQGVARYDGEEFTVFTREDGLASNNITSIIQDSEGDLWFGAYGGISRYDGKRFVTVGTRDDLHDDQITFLLQDRDGDLWFATWGGGIGQYDGTVFQSLLRRDGLADNQVRCLLEDSERTMWIGTDGGVTCFRPTRSEPAVRIIDVLSEGRHGPVSELSIPSTRSYVSFEFSARSFKTRPEQLIFIYRLENYQEQWQQTRERRVEYTDLPHGDYVFQVRVVDRDLAYSAKPAEVRLDVHPPYVRIALAGGTGAALLVILLVSGYALRRRRDLHRAERALLGELERELQTAHDLQMGLMPAGPPQISGFDIAGRCLPANQVGGDFFQYYYEKDGGLSICLADVTGHAMEAAVPVMMFSGVLETEIRHGDPLEKLFGNLNTVLSLKLESRTYVCFVMGELDPSTRKLRLSNSGCPYPYHYQCTTREVAELQLNAYPLGVNPETQYQTREIQLSPGDRVVFCSDGITDADNAEGEIFGFARTAEIIRGGCQNDLSAEQLVDHIIREVKEFTGDAAQGDDQTVVVLSVERE